jgi:hypothetical protein
MSLSSVDLLLFFFFLLISVSSPQLGVDPLVLPFGVQGPLSSSANGVLVRWRKAAGQADREYNWSPAVVVGLIIFTWFPRLHLRVQLGDASLSWTLFSSPGDTGDWLCIRL